MLLCEPDSVLAADVGDQAAGMLVAAQADQLNVTAKGLKDGEPLLLEAGLT